MAVIAPESGLHKPGDHFIYRPSGDIVISGTVLALERITAEGPQYRVHIDGWHPWREHGLTVITKEIEKALTWT